VQLAGESHRSSNGVVCAVYVCTQEWNALPMPAMTVDTTSIAALIAMFLQLVEGNHSWVHQVTRTSEALVLGTPGRTHWVLVVKYSKLGAQSNI
jgi:hypothetical protein